MKIIISSEYFTGFFYELEDSDLMDIEELSEICDKLNSSDEFSQEYTAKIETFLCQLLKTSLISYLEGKNLEFLLEKARKLNLHFHGENLIGELKREGSVYLCDH